MKLDVIQSAIIKFYKEMNSNFFNLTHYCYSNWQYFSNYKKNEFSTFGKVKMFWKLFAISAYFLQWHKIVAISIGIQPSFLSVLIRSFCSFPIYFPSPKASSTSKKSLREVILKLNCSYVHIEPADSDHLNWDCNRS